jgi:hypothetical protein
VTAAEQPLPPATVCGIVLRDSTGEASPALKSAAARALANRRWSRTPRADRAAVTKAGRAVVWAGYLNQVDPDRELPAAEREQLAREAERAHMQALAIARHHRKEA